MYNSRSACPTSPVTTVAPSTYIVQRQPDPIIEAACMAAAGGKLVDMIYAAALLKQRRAERAAHNLHCDQQRAALASLNRPGSL